MSCCAGAKPKCAQKDCTCSSNHAKLTKKRCKLAFVTSIEYGHYPWVRLLDYETEPSRENNKLHVINGTSIEQRLGRSPDIPFYKSHASLQRRHERYTLKYWTCYFLSLVSGYLRSLGLNLPDWHYIPYTMIGE